MNNFYRHPADVLRNFEIFYGALRLRAPVDIGGYFNQSHGVLLHSEFHSFYKIILSYSFKICFSFFEKRSSPFNKIPGSHTFAKKLSFGIKTINAVLKMSV